MILAFAVLALLATPVLAPAQVGGRSAEEIEKEAEADRARAQALRRKANVLSEEVRALKAESVAVARRTQDLETDLSAVEETLASLQAEETAKQKELRSRRAQMTETLAALQRIAVQPPEALAVAPGSPMEVVRGAMMLRVAVPAIEGRAARLRGDLEELAKLRRDIEEQRETMRATAAKLAEERRHLSTLLDRKKELRARTAAQSEAAARRADKLAEEAADMRELLAHLRRQAEIRAEALAARTPKPPEKPAAPSESQGGASTAGTAATPDTSQVARLNRPPDIRAFPGNKASLRMPARGRVVTRYGERVRRAGGPTESRGIAIATRPAAQVVAPYDGQVVYAGPFKGYGRILIIEHGQRYHSLLAGLERIDAIVGQWVLAGEPVGVMGGSQGQNPELYVELRRTGQPINPLPWLAQTGDKVRG